MSDTATQAGSTQLLQNPAGASPLEAPTGAVGNQTTYLGKLPVPPGWSIAIGCIGLVMVAGTRFGGIAAGIGGVAVIYQLGGWIVSATAAPAAQPATTLV